MTVYVITRGDYSDYHICAVSLDKDKAKRLAKMYSDNYDDAHVEEWETDTVADINALNGRRPYYVQFNPDGSVDAFERTYEYWEFEPGVDELDYGIVSFRVYAPDEEKARKIACDMRAKYLAEKEGIV